MSRTLRTKVALVLLTCVSLGTGCTSGVFVEDLRQFLRDTTKDTAIAIGDFVVEHAVTDAFE